MTNGKIIIYCQIIKNPAYFRIQQAFLDRNHLLINIPNICRHFKHQNYHKTLNFSDLQALLLKRMYRLVKCDK